MPALEILDTDGNIARVDPRAVAAGLAEAAQACSSEQVALKTRLDIAAATLIQLSTAGEHAAATLRGIREMAMIEAQAGSNAWRKSISLIDASLKELA